MKQNIYLFSNTILKKKNSTLYLEIYENSTPAFEADIDEKEQAIMLVGMRDKIEPSGKKYIPVDNVESIYSFGEVRFTSQFLNCVSHYNIPVHVFNYYGTYTGTFLPKDRINSGNILISQAECYINKKNRLYIAGRFVKGAAENSLSNLKYYLYRGLDIKFEIQRISELSQKTESAESIGQLLGLEGNIKNIYYGCWKKIFRQEVEFEKRVRNPPDNMINSLISFGNTIMYSICLNEIYRTGLNPVIGYLHSTGDRRLPLSFDVAEIFKPLIIDKVIFRVINLEMIKENDFQKKGNLLFIKSKAKRKFIVEIEERMKSTFMHPDLKRNVSYKTLIRLECYKLINYLRDNLGFEAYKGSV